MPVCCIAPEESVEVPEAQPRSPLVERAVRTLQPIGNQVMLTEPRGVVAIAHKNVADGRRGLGKDRIVPRISGCELGNVAEPDTMVVAAGQQGGACGRTQGSGVKVVEAQSVRGDAI